VPVGAVLAEQPEGGRGRPGDRRRELLDDAAGQRERVAAARRVHESRERDDQVDPVPGGRERHFERGDEPRRAVRVIDHARLPVALLQHARRRLDRDDARGGDVARFAQPAPGDRAHAARPAGDEAADGRSTLRRGMHAQLPPFRPRRAIEVAHLPSRSDAHQAGTLPLDRVERRHVDHHAALQRHRLAVIAGAAAARGDRHAVAEAGGGDADHVRLVARADHRLRRLAAQLPVQHRAVPEEVARFLPHQRGYGGEGDAREIVQQALHVALDRTVHHASARLHPEHRLMQ